MGSEMNYIEYDANAIARHLPPGTKVPPNSEALFRIYAVLMRAKGTQTQLEDVHDAWTAWISHTESDHESARPYAELDPETQSADKPFLDAILAVAKQRSL